MLIFSVAILSFVVAVVSNRLIGNKDILPWIPLRRPTIYALNGLLMSLLAYVVGGYNVYGIAAAGAISTIGFAMFRQPGPDIAFTAGTGRAANQIPDPKWILWLLENVHGITGDVFIATWGDWSNKRKKAAILAGAYRGLWILPLALGMSIVFYGPTFLLSLTGLLFGVAYWFTGVDGPWKKEEGMVMRAELIMGGLIVWPNMALPIILGGLS
jgi:hypothetical protein